MSDCIPSSNVSAERLAELRAHYADPLLSTLNAYECAALAQLLSPELPALEQAATAMLTELRKDYEPGELTDADGVKAIRKLRLIAATVAHRGVEIEGNAEPPKACPECAHREAYYAQFDLVPKVAAETKLDRPCTHRFTVDGLRNPRSDDKCDGCGATWQQVQDALRPHETRAAPMPDPFASKYHELLLAVERKFPGESRHATALRYIREAERQANEGTAAQSEDVATND